MSDGMEWERCPEHGPACHGGICCCRDLHPVRSIQSPETGQHYAGIVDYVVTEIAPEITRLFQQAFAEPQGDEWADERADVLARFAEELAKATGDGSKKRQAGEKPPWYEDDSHEGAIFSHLTRWKRGEKVDPDSGAHPLVHLAWRALAIACRETGNVPS